VLARGVQNASEMFIVPMGKNSTYIKSDRLSSVGREMTALFAAHILEPPNSTF
jgi:hypothetical protein